MSSPASDVRSLMACIAPDMANLNEVIRQSLHSEVDLINTISDYIIGAGGKRLRPALVILGARAFSGS
ncbi:MAG: octaprenyl diphosphate synthase, partial [Limnobacter sp.]|nr:octaprenyl diphosphate synthase [Limnobacter sp.]